MRLRVYIHWRGNMRHMILHDTTPRGALVDTTAHGHGRSCGPSVSGPTAFSGHGCTPTRPDAGGDHASHPASAHPSDPHAHTQSITAHQTPPRHSTCNGASWTIALLRRAAPARRAAPMPHAAPTPRAAPTPHDALAFHSSRRASCLVRHCCELDATLADKRQRVSERVSESVSEKPRSVSEAVGVGEKLPSASESALMGAHTARGQSFC